MAALDVQTVTATFHVGDAIEVIGARNQIWLSGKAKRGQPVAKWVTARERSTEDGR